MCEALRRLMKEDLEAAMNKGISQGISQGLSQGKREGKLAMLSELVKENMLSIKDAAQKANMTEDEFAKMLAAQDMN